MSEREILERDGYRCTETVYPRVIKGRTIGHTGRCPGMGSDVFAHDGRTICPRHYRLLSTQRELNELTNSNTEVER